MNRSSNRTIATAPSTFLWRLIGETKSTWSMPAGWRRGLCSHFARRPRTPASIAFHPTPWRFRLAAVPIEAFPNWGASRPKPSDGVRLRRGERRSPPADNARPIPHRSPGRIALRLCGDCPSRPVGPFTLLHEKLLPAIEQPDWSPLSEEYFVFPFSTRRDGLRRAGKSPGVLAAMGSLDGRPGSFGGGAPGRKRSRRGLAGCA